MRTNYYQNKIFGDKTESEFEKLCLEIFRFQYQNNLIYRQYVDLVKSDIHTVKTITDIPFLPIELFKNQKVIHKDYEESITFFSSGTTGQTRSKHFVANEEIYQKSLVEGFERVYGNIKEYCFIALLPGYLERKGSSLIYMVNLLMQISDNKHNGFYLNEFEKLRKTLNHLKKNNQKFILIGVSHALIDFANAYSIDLSGAGIVMETGGMKGRKKEMLKEELHSYLKSRFNVEKIHSEYGMTELLSQAYSQGNGIFSTPNWMKILIRDSYDPFSYMPTGKTGGINVIDLANIYSCSFIETKDLGRVHKNQQFEITGRFDNSDIRGCNLLVINS